MLRLITSLAFAVILHIPLHAQLLNGSEFDVDIRGVDIITGEQVSVLDWLGSGKAVMLDIFGATCGPCWDLHESGYFKNLNDLYGPEGTDQLRILALQGYEHVENAHLSDWMIGVEYNMMNDASYNDELQINYFPTVYLIRPDSIVIEANLYDKGVSFYNAEIISKYLFQSNIADIGFEGILGGTSFCNTTEIKPKLTIYNYTANKVDTAFLDLKIDDEILGHIIATNIPAYGESDEIQVLDHMIEATSEVSLTVGNIDGNPDVDDSVSQLSAFFQKEGFKENNFVLELTVDDFPSEINWNLLDENDNVLLSVDYSEIDNVDSIYANTTFSYDVELDGDFSTTCLDFVINDNYGDGLSSYDQLTNPIPGLRIVNSDGQVLRDMLNTDRVFGNVQSIGFQVESKFSSTDNNAIYDDQINIYPILVDHEINVSIGPDVVGSTEVIFADYLGRIVNASPSNNQNENSLQRFDVSSLSSGLHFAIILVDGKVGSSKMFIKN